MQSVAIIIVLFWLIIGVVAVMVFNRAWIRLRTDWRLQEQAREPEQVLHRRESHETTGLRHWLRKAGFRSPYAPGIFIACVVLSLLTGALVYLILALTGFTQQMMTNAAKLPGGAADLVTPILAILPWMAMIVVIVVPVLVVRSVRRRRVEAVEQDLPVVLEMLSTLSEAGLAFDAAVDRIIESMSRGRPLVQEFRIFRVESISGRQRIQCFRRMARRIDVINFNVFIAAIVQAEQVGASLAHVLRQQADDMRSRRRERALEFTMSRPVKLLIPLVTCFLPAVLVWTLGPVFYELLGFLEGMIRR